MKKKLIKGTLLVLLILLVGIQFFPTKRNQSEEILNTDLAKITDVPSDVLNMLKTSCYDCHSNNTVYPWYSNIQPFAWMLEDHVVEGKEELNFSEFGDYSDRRKKSKLKSIASHIKDDKMPLSTYTMIHSDAVLSEKEKIALIDWANELRKSY